MEEISSPLDGGGDTSTPHVKVGVSDGTEITRYSRTVEVECDLRFEELPQSCTEPSVIHESFVRTRLLKSYI